MSFESALRLDASFRENEDENSPASRWRAPALQYVREGAPVDVYCTLPGLSGAPSLFPSPSRSPSPVQHVRWTLNGSAFVGIGGGGVNDEELTARVLRIPSFRASRHAGTYYCVAHESALPAPVLGAATQLVPACMSLTLQLNYQTD